MTQTLVPFGEPDAVRESVERVSAIADSITIMPTLWGVPEERSRAYGERIEGLFFA